MGGFDDKLIEDLLNHPFPSANNAEKKRCCLLKRILAQLRMQH